MAKKKDNLEDVTKTPAFIKLTEQPWYSDFAFNVKRDGNDLLHLCKVNPPRMWLLVAFGWTNTPQGFDYWDKVNSGWVRSFKNL